MISHPFRIFGVARRALSLAPTCLALASLPVAADHTAQHVSEKDYFAELPVVLSVSRLAQPLDEVGAVTVIDVRQLDARLGYAFRAGATRGEVSVTVQSLGGSHMEYERTQRFGRRAFATLRLDL